MLEGFFPPISIVQANKLFNAHPLSQLYLAAHGQRAFDFFLAEVTFRFDGIGKLSESQTRNLVRLLVRQRAAEAEVKGRYGVKPISASEIVSRLAMLDQYEGCLPDVSGILTVDYWSHFVEFAAYRENAPFMLRKPHSSRH